MDNKTRRKKQINNNLDNSNSPKRNQNNTKRIHKENVLLTKKKVILFFVGFFVTFALIAMMMFFYVRNITKDMPALTKQMVSEHYINKNPVSLDEIPEDLQNAVIAIEDQRFYKHGGIDYKSLFRAVINNILTDTTQGGSTIDMQVSKNLFTSEKKTIERKIKDMYNAHMLNNIMTKNEILEIYLNNIYLGKSAYGVDAGALQYYDCDISDLDFYQCTMLAGITNNPLRFQNYSEAKKRQRVVLYKMYELGYINKEQYKKGLYKDAPFKSEIE